MIAVIGDIHGCYLTLRKLIKEVRRQYFDIMMYATGDLVDRGNFPVEVFELLLDEGIQFTKGNHDLMFLYSYTRPLHPFVHSWGYNGNEKTISAYAKHPNYLSKHLDYIEIAPLFLHFDDCLITHAGIASIYAKEFRGYRPISDEFLQQFCPKHINETTGVVWNRNPLLNLGKLQIVGHTRHAKVTHNEISNAVYVDTSVYTGDRLSAVIIEEGEVVDIISVETELDDIA
ncbi:MAG: diadenosine tetraphosphatase [Ignavibacteria bacterium CG_4_8_14_3_um_filter_37_9]|nr:diadenosine tetraphosphatase [Ignavibacteria bacterium]OIO20579.1 MAG: hypothetical protein AUJ54_05180 [Ignavibacteria bacterium CG1_02_37_35]PIS45309.1 MAG: diadenosine tetraphosphatase [Ignavibacteria bacterium CG08_land_8_20_14_0_20_37_9]PIW98044.1 MAG: diadenosine tetraphosphatase [Ignavibacteria bacterium CG_4_8_14_3_um_filter_37_9]PIX94910.1 MAG: diadenosine tetraphosphatase [Ignavibacteria bacterium CG_4_10_14_3_um_filter_37_18]PJC59203.1 MAG: diadenosine tetraphosphatase [Ignavibac